MKAVGTIVAAMVRPPRHEGVNHRSEQFGQGHVLVDRPTVALSMVAVRGDCGEP